MQVYNVTARRPGCHLHGETEEYHGASFQAENTDGGFQKHKVILTTELQRSSADVLHRAGCCRGKTLHLYLFRRKWVQISARRPAVLRDVYMILLGSSEQVPGYCLE
jgi:hypothetical protein